MKDEKNKVKVKIYGEEYTIKSELPVNYMKRLAEYVNTKMHELSQGSGSISNSKIAVLTAINLSNEIYNLKREVKKLTIKLDEKSKKTGDSK